MSGRQVANSWAPAEGSLRRWPTCLLGPVISCFRYTCSGLCYLRYPYVRSISKTYSVYFGSDPMLSLVLLSFVYHIASILYDMLCTVYDTLLAIYYVPLQTEHMTHGM